MRPGVRERGYTPEWDALAAAFKQRSPWCCCCWSVGVRRATQIVDHIVPVADDPSRLLDPSNLQPCCRDCHDHIKRVLEKQWRVGKIRAADLDLRSDAAYVVRRKLHRPMIGPDGYPIEEGLDEVRSIPSKGAGSKNVWIDRAPKPRRPFVRKVSKLSAIPLQQKRSCSSMVRAVRS
jgi:hypothetical protein